MKQTDKLVAIIAAGIITAILLVPWLRGRFQQTGDDKLEIDIVPPFQFKRTDKRLADRILEAINRMGAVGNDAEEKYQKSLKELKPHATNVVEAIGEELKLVPTTQYLDRWSLIQLLADLQDPASLPLLDTILSSKMPTELYKDPHARSSLRQETINLTTAVEAITRIASEHNRQATELLLKHTAHESLSVRRASVQGYLLYGGGEAREKLLKHLPQQDHYLLDIRKMDIQDVPPIRVKASEIPSRPDKAISDRKKTATDVPVVPPLRDNR